jgi:hypothetical protein
MHASLMRRHGARFEVAPDNMGHAGGSGSITLDVYSKTWVGPTCRCCEQGGRSCLCRIEARTKRLTFH